jgi:hypothetical protein
MKHITLLIAIALCFTANRQLAAQESGRWQQRAEYQMVIDFDVAKHQYRGQQNLVYYNNSPDTLERVFYHLYYNAFQPNSMMDMRSRTILDPDPRVTDRILHLAPEEQGYQRVLSLKQNGQPTRYKEVETILAVDLPEPILPGGKAVFEMEFEAQVPVLIRRAGRDSDEGIAYSMAQWYPKLCEYDYQGWHPTPYIGREFHGVWGDFDVTITIDRDFIVAASGLLQNPEQIGYGYESSAMAVQRPAGPKLSWRFRAERVHDFVWAADKAYTHDSFVREDGTVLRFFYVKDEKTQEPWSRLPAIMDKALEYIEANYGPYGYPQYAFIQGGDGGMEYPMATLITGWRNLSSLVGVSVHELMHHWYQMVLASNESLYAWMDEGFTNWATSEVMNHLRAEGLLPGRVLENPHQGNYAGYVNFAMSGFEEPLIIHADHFQTNSAYGVAAYVKGGIFLEQLRYIIGEEHFRRGLLRYYHSWKHRHPNANDFVRVFEKQSGLQLAWYREYWINTTHTIDYAVQGLEAVPGQPGQTKVTLEKIGIMPMPLDVRVILNDGTEQDYNIPLRIMHGHKPLQEGERSYTLLEAWPWTHPEYEFTIEARPADIRQLVIDPRGRMADVNRENNRWPEP